MMELYCPKCNKKMELFMPEFVGIIPSNYVCECGEITLLYPEEALKKYEKQEVVE